MSRLQKSYEFLLSLEEHLLNKLKDGAKLGDVYASVMSMVKKEKPDLAGKITKSFGFAMGIEFREAAISITQGSEVVARKGMVFNVNIGLNGLTNKGASGKGKDVALFVGDTVLVGEVMRSLCCAMFCHKDIV